MARGNFGERLKRERDLREVSMDELTKATRISTRFIQALENEEWQKLPGGVFGRGFVRTVARYLGLDEEALLAEYDLARGDQSQAAPLKAEERIPSPPKWIPALVVLIVLLIAAGLFYAGRYGWRRYTVYRATKKSAVSSPAIQPKPQTDTATPVLAAGSPGNSLTPSLDLSVPTFAPRASGFLLAASFFSTRSSPLARPATSRSVSNSKLRRETLPRYCWN